MKITFWLILMSLLLSIPALASEPNLNLEKLQQDKDFESGCSCSVTNSNNEFLVVSELQDKAPAIVRIYGQRKVLKWISSTEKSRSPKKGDTFNRIYSDGNMKLRLDYRTTFVCGKDDESCEVTRYSVEATLEDGNKKTEIKKLNGDCGC